MKNILNLAMVVCIPAAMDYRFTANMVHEIVSVLVILFVVFHNVLNRHWYMSIGRGKASWLRGLRIGTNLLLVIMVSLSALTGIFISKSLFPAISVSGNLWIHELHTLSSYLGFILCGIHLGFHWNTIWDKLCYWLEIGRTDFRNTFLSRAVSVFIAGCGVHASFTHRIGSKLLLRDTYTSWGAKPLLIDFLLGYLAIMGCYVVVTHYLTNMVSNGITENAGDGYGKKGQAR